MGGEGRGTGKEKNLAALVQSPDFVLCYVRLSIRYLIHTVAEWKDTM